MDPYDLLIVHTVGPPDSSVVPGRITLPTRVMPAVSDPLVVESTVNVVPEMWPVPDHVGLPDIVGTPKLPDSVFGGVVHGGFCIGLAGPPPFCCTNCVDAHALVLFPNGIVGQILNVCAAAPPDVNAKA